MLPLVFFDDLGFYGIAGLGPFRSIFIFAIISGLLDLGLRLKRRPIPEITTLSVFIWVVLPGLAGAHLFGLVAYAPDELFVDHDYSQVFNFWGNLSSFGALIVGAGGWWALSRQKRLSSPLQRSLADRLVAPLLLGFTVGRLGCALTHDHTGGRTDFLLAVKFPGGSFHDLGVYEFLILLFIFWPLALVVERRSRRPGTLTGVLALSYGLVRFLLDEMRIYETVYLGLTPAQYGCIALGILGAYVLATPKDSA